MSNDSKKHVFVHSKILGKSFCVHCGLIRLNNRFTDWAAKKDCGDDITLDPQYNKMRKLTNPMV